jgi:hypothetical protein
MFQFFNPYDLSSFLVASGNLIAFGSDEQAGRSYITISSGLVSPACSRQALAFLSSVVLT